MKGLWLGDLHSMDKCNTEASRYKEVRGPKAQVKRLESFTNIESQSLQFSKSKRDEVHDL